MISSEFIQRHHLDRRAAIYIRQSTPHQVLTNTESQKMQRAMREHVLRMGWPDDRIAIIEGDTGTTATTTFGRDAYKNLLSEVALGHVGIVLSYESARLARNCSDWYPLLDLCAIKNCLIADRDGVYEPWTPNGRLLLGMKGILSEIEMHTIRGRLLAGVQNKAKRGELALGLPAGLVRREDGVVVKDPDRRVQEAIGMLFDSFLELRSATKVVRHFNEHQLRTPRRQRNDETVWRPATMCAVVRALHNPAYAGAFVYGKTHTVRNLDGNGSPRPRQQRRPMNEWGVIVKDRYPAYISWETFERIQSMLRDNHAEYERKQSRGVPREGAALLQGLMYCGHCGHKMVVQYKRYTRYLCHNLPRQRPLTGCQHVPADPIDGQVVNAFFQALAPSELDLYEQAMQTRRDQWSQIDAAQERELARLRYEVQLARRQYDRVDPDNRLVASELEQRWEAALRALREADESLASARRERDKVVPLHVPRELRAAFSSLGQSLPGLWQQGTLRRAQKKALLRCLIDKVVAHRKIPHRVAIRIVWRGGAVSEIDIPIPVGSIHDVPDLQQMEEQLLDLEAKGKSDDEVARLLTEKGFRSPSQDTVLASTVKVIRLRHRRIHRFRGPRPRRVPGGWTLHQVAEQLGVKPQWLYHQIRRGVLEVDRDGATGLYLFPDRPEALDHLRRLQAGAVEKVCYRRGHQDA